MVISIFEGNAGDDHVTTVDLFSFSSCSRQDPDVQSHATGNEVVVPPEATLHDRRRDPHIRRAVANMRLELQL